ncbi:hypothetical protein A2Z53_01730 [Candidatus Giovannonibacteria bacterium RIFCSPHIGHO2_02_42_15]|uniref:Putative membrane protein insertion efficiency factor n=1 Tax=Candidatus Giovannonibacteria bacterium RIFCSPHIGHO2_02_42_15 TaxID=1798329 RepID=A0A1F5VN39_9BACT|nr:MAG: hypothetical protein A2Z53_01730 [Candidatus Giovannonibacteria bacterium RIFCSPHIGHO2_02_42_15]
MRKIIIGLLRFYQKIISPDQGIFSQGRKYCVFEPSCSEYTILAIEKYGFLGFFKGVRRVLSCNPWQKKFFDPLT